MLKVFVFMREKVSYTQLRRKLLRVKFVRLDS